ncbi:hypothetical protein SEF58_13050 [Neomoorella humiferrea]|uniref:Uncharacterized protein n=1 Tax=Neomoorella humiferrea TaxID=676965 RepID=A0A2T0AQS5_9FIRM|nr:hypothetical protein [Moorella humiferrea]PRR71778.1 hypothetical protein MOHU_16070 [Moorella humiferrea]
MAAAFKAGIISGREDFIDGIDAFFNGALPVMKGTSYSYTACWIFFYGTGDNPYIAPGNFKSTRRVLRY